MTATMMPITLEILACFLLSSSLLYRYADFVNQNAITIVAVFVSWFFSFMVIFMLPADISSSAYRQCLADHNQTTNNNNASITAFMDYNHQQPNANLLATNTTLVDSITQMTNKTVIQPDPSSTLLSTFVANNSDQQTNGTNGTNTNTTQPCTLPWNYFSPKVFPKLWRFIYWSCQLLTWIILPLMQSYSMAGDFTPWEKFKSALKANLIYYSSYGAIFSVLLIYVIFKNGLDFTNLKVIAITSSNTWGLLLLVVLLGYGLIELPRYLITRSRCASSLNHLYYRVARLNAEKCEAEEKLDDSLEEIHQAFSAMCNRPESHPIRRCLDLIVDKCPPDWKRRSIAFRRQTTAANSSSHTINMDTDYTLDTMIRLHRKVIRSVHFYRQTNCRWSRLIKEVVEWEDVARNLSESTISSHAKVFQSSIPRRRTQSIYDTIKYLIFTPTVEWYWKCSIRAWLLKASGFAMAALSLAVVWSEMTFSIRSPVLSIFANVVNASQHDQNYFIMELFSIISIGYLAFCAFYTVFKMRIFNIYYLAINHQTDEYSLLFSGMLLCRLASPLCLNYLCLIQRDSHILKQENDVGTAFTSIMGHLDLIPIVSNGLNIFLPLCISAICLALYLNLGTHLLHNLGFEQFIEGDEMTQDWIQNGKELVKREKNKLLRNFEASGHYYNMNSGSSTDPALSDRKQHPDYASTLPIDGSSRDSLTSTSSGLSRSSLIPKGSHDGTGDASTTMDFYTTSATTRTIVGDPLSPDPISLGSPTLTTTTTNQNNSSNDNSIHPSKGFFDDI